MIIPDQDAAEIAHFLDFALSAVDLVAFNAAAKGIVHAKAIRTRSRIAELQSRLRRAGAMAQPQPAARKVRGPRPRTTITTRKGIRP